MSNKTPAPKIESVAKSIRIIEEIAKHGGLTPKELANTCDLPLGTAFDHLYTLESIGYIVKSENNYRLGTPLLRLGDRMRKSIPIYQQSKSHLDDLAQKTGKHASVMIEENGYGVYLYTAEGDTNLTLTGSLGVQTPLHVSAPGKSLLAFMPRDRIDRILSERGLESATDATITSKNKLNEQLEEIREQGFSHDSEEGVRGLYGVATPVVDRTNDSVIGAVSLYTAADTNINQFEQAVIDDLLKTKNMIEINLTYGDSA